MKLSHLALVLLVFAGLGTFFVWARDENAPPPPLAGTEFLGDPEPVADTRDDATKAADARAEAIRVEGPNKELHALHAQSPAARAERAGEEALAGLLTGTSWRFDKIGVHLTEGRTLITDDGTGGSWAVRGGVLTVTLNNAGGGALAPIRARVRKSADGRSVDLFTEDGDQPITRGE